MKEIKKENLEYVQKLVPWASMVVIGLLVSFGALNDKQRKAIVKRDGGCAAPFEHKCNAEKGHEVHHISPQRWEKNKGIPEEIRDRPENLLTLCKNAHQEVHPDLKIAMKKYHEHKKKNVNSIEEMEKERKKKVEKGIPYWNTIFDQRMSSKARWSTEIALTTDWEFPSKGKRKKRKAA